MTFRITGLAPELFRPLFELDDEALQRLGARRVFADGPRLPCRVSVAHAGIGEEMLLLNYTHQAANTPYHAAHAIYVRKAADRAFDGVDAVPDVLTSRPISLRVFDASHDMIDAALCEGDAVRPAIERMLANPKTSYVQAHYAIRGCYAARIERA